MPAAMRATLRWLAALPVAIVFRMGHRGTGLAGFVQFDGAAYVGSPGLDIAGFPGIGPCGELDVAEGNVVTHGEVVGKVDAHGAARGLTPRGPPEQAPAVAPPETGARPRVAWEPC